MRDLLDSLNIRGFIPESYEERNLLLRSLGCNLLKSFFIIDNQLNMVTKQGTVLYPWDLRVLDVDPMQRIVQIEMYLHGPDTTLSFWMDVDTLIEAGNNPVVNTERGYALDKAWMCEEQPAYINEAMLIPPVILFGRERHVELEAHIDYLLQVLYGVRGYEGPDGKLSYIATDIQLAESWCRAAIIDGEAKAEKVLGTKRWYAFLDRMDTLKRKQNNTLSTPKQVINTELVDKLSGLL